MTEWMRQMADAAGRRKKGDPEDVVVDGRGGGGERERKALCLLDE